MKYEDKFHLTPEENRRFAKTNLTKLVFTNSRFEDLTTTLPQTQTIIDGIGVDGVLIADINTIVQLKRGWRLAINAKGPLTLALEKELNAVVACDNMAFPGYLRDKAVVVDTYRGNFVPPMIDRQKEEHYLSSLLASECSATDKAMTLMYHNMRGQLFCAGNKRTAIIVANKMMIDNGAGLINVPLDYWPTWQKLLADYYFSTDMTELKDWTYEHAIQGIEPNWGARLAGTSKEISPEEQAENIAEFKQLWAELRRLRSQDD